MKSFNFRVNEQMYQILDKYFGSKIDRTKPWSRADVIHIAINYALAKVMAVPVAEAQVKAAVVPSQPPQAPEAPPRYPPLVRPGNGGLPPPVPLVPPEEMESLVGDDHGMGL